MEHAARFEWRADGEDAEVRVFAPDGSSAERAFRRALPAAALPGVEGPVSAALSPEGFGMVAASRTHAAPALVSAPVRAVLLVADTPAERVAVPDLAGRLRRGLAETLPSLPRLDRHAVARLCEQGALAAAEDALIPEEDLPFFVPREGAPREGAPREGDPDALGNRALAAAERTPEDRFGLRLAVAAEVLDAEGAGGLGLEESMLVLVLEVGAADLGRLALEAHRERVRARVLSGADFGASPELPAAPQGSEEAADLAAALGAAANFADARACRTLHALRRALADATGALDVRASWAVGGLEAREGLILHRDNLAAVEGDVLVSGGDVSLGGGKMFGSAPAFGGGEGGEDVWREAGLVEPLVRLEALEGRG